MIVGGYNSAWPLYLPAARHLESVTGQRAVAVPLMPWHWWTAGRRHNAALLLDKLDGAVGWARRRRGAERCTLVCHSAGGLVARLYVCGEGAPGGRYEGAGLVDAIYTLGSPHCQQRGTATGWYLNSLANRAAPGTPHNDTIAYRAVAGQAVEGRADGSPREQVAYRNYRAIGGEGNGWGDGTVSLACARLDGAENVTLDGVGHSLHFGRWYLSSPDVIRRWWTSPPVAGLEESPV